MSCGTLVIETTAAFVLSRCCGVNNNVFDGLLTWLRHCFRLVYSLRTVSTDGITPQTQDFIFGSSWAGSWSCLSWCPWALKNLQALKHCHERSSEDTFRSRWWVSQVLMISKLRLPLLPTKACWATAAQPWITWAFYCRGCKIQPDQQTWSQCTD